MPEIVKTPQETQQNPDNISYTNQNQAVTEMAQPLHDPSNSSEDAGLAPYLGVIATIVIVGFLGWKFFKSKK